MNFGCYHIDNTQRSISARSCAHLAGTAVPCAAGFDAGPMEPLSLLLLSPKALPLQPEPFQTQQLLQPCLGSAETCPMPRQASSRSLWESAAPGSPHNLFPLPQALTFPTVISEIGWIIYGLFPDCCLFGEIILEIRW